MNNGNMQLSIHLFNIKCRWSPYAMWDTRSSYNRGLSGKFGEGFYFNLGLTVLPHPFLGYRINVGRADKYNAQM